MYWTSKNILKLYEEDKMTSIFRAGCSINKTEPKNQKPSKQKETFNKMHKDSDISNLPRNHAVTKHCSHLIQSLSKSAVLFHIFNQKSLQGFISAFI